MNLMIDELKFYDHKSKKEAGKPRYVGTICMIKGNWFMFTGKKWEKIG